MAAPTSKSVKQTWNYLNLDRHERTGFTQSSIGASCDPIGASSSNRNQPRPSPSPVSDYRMEKLSRSIRRAVNAGSARRFAASAQQSREKVEQAASGRKLGGIENQGKHFWEAPFSPSEWKGNESSFVAMGVAGVGVYFLLDFWLKSKRENRAALESVAKPEHPKNPDRGQLTPKDAMESMLPVGVGKDGAETKPTRGPTTKD